jgi:O-antigen/teichoic acid export membrane protein
MSLSKRIAYNSLLQIVSKVIATILGLAAVAIMTRYLGQAGFGEYTIIINFLSFLAILIDFGLTLVTAQMLSRPGVNQDYILGNLFSLRFASAVIFLGVGPLSIFFFPYSLAVKTGVLIAAWAFFFNALNQILVGLFQKELRLEMVAAAEVASKLILAIGIFAVAYFDLGLKGILVFTVISNGASFFLHYLFSLKFSRIKFVFDKIIWQEIIKKAWPISLTIIFNLIYLKSDIFILSLIKNQGEVGVYGAAYKVVDIFVTIPFMFAGLMLPILTASWAKKDFLGFKKAIQKSFDVMVVLAAPLVVGTQFIAEKAMVLVAGREFAVSGPALKVLIAAAGSIFLGSIFSHAIIAIDRQKNIISAYVFTSITALSGYLIFIPRYSYFGAAWVTVYSETVIALSSFLLVWKQTKIIPDFKIFFKAIIASFLMGVILYFYRDLSLFSLLFIAITTYALALYLLKGFNFLLLKEINSK